VVNKLVARLDMDMDEELDFTLLAITCPLKDYRLCHFINKVTNLDFSRGKESKYDHDGRPKNKSEEELEYHIIFDAKKKISYHFTAFHYLSPDSDTEYFLINNKSIEGTFLIPENPHFDFFVIIKNYICEDDVEYIIKRISKLPEVVIAKEISPKILKSKENLIF